MKKIHLKGFLVLPIVFLLVSSAFAEYISDEELYKKAVSLNSAIGELDLRIKKLNIELTIMEDVFHERPTRLPASQIPVNDKGKPVVKLTPFKESLQKLSKRDLRGKIKDNEDEVRERNKTLTRLKKERDEIFRLIKYRVRGMM